MCRIWSLINTPPLPHPYHFSHPESAHLHPHLPSHLYHLLGTFAPHRLPFHALGFISTTWRPPHQQQQTTLSLPSKGELKRSTTLKNAHTRLVFEGGINITATLRPRRQAYKLVFKEVLLLSNTTLKKEHHVLVLKGGCYFSTPIFKTELDTLNFEASS